MTYREMTIAEVLKDPLIRQVMKADKISLRAMKKLLRETAQLQRTDSRPQSACSCNQSVSGAMSVAPMCAHAAVPTAAA